MHWLFGNYRGHRHERFRLILEQFNSWERRFPLCCALVSSSEIIKSNVQLKDSAPSSTPFMLVRWAKEIRRKWNRPNCWMVLASAVPKIYLTFPPQPFFISVRNYNGKLSNGREDVSENLRVGVQVSAFVLLCLPYVGGSWRAFSCPPPDVMM